jgi:hypothetical protein
MFRTLFALAVVLASGGAICASDLPQGSGIVGQGQNPADPAARASEDHLRSQLDWRSYYLNRMGGRHDRQSAFFSGTSRRAPATPN